MAVSPSSLLQRLDVLKKWQQTQEQRLMSQMEQQLHDAENADFAVLALAQKTEKCTSNFSSIPLLSPQANPPPPQIVTINDKPTQPFLRRGTGLQKYRMRPDEQKVVTNRKLKYFKGSAHKRISLHERQARNSVPQEIINEITPLKVPETVFRLTSSEGFKDENIVHHFIDKLLSQQVPPSSLALENQHDDSQVSHVPGEQTVYERALENELQIFEAMERKVLQSSFSSTNSSVVQLLSSSTPNKFPRGTVTGSNTRSVEEVEKVERTDDIDTRNEMELETPTAQSECDSSETETEQSECNGGDDWSQEQPLRQQRPVIVRQNAAVNTDPEVCEKDERVQQLQELVRQVQIGSSSDPQLRRQRDDFDIRERALRAEIRDSQRALETKRQAFETDVHSQRQKLAREKAVFDKYMKEQRDNNKPSRKERDEISSLKLQVEQLRETIKLKDSRNGMTQARLRNQIKALEKSSGELREELDTLRKQNARLQATMQRTAVQKQRQPSDTKVLHEINKSLSKLATKTRNSSGDSTGSLSRTPTSAASTDRSRPNSSRKASESDTTSESTSEHDPNEPDPIDDIARTYERTFGVQSPNRNTPNQESTRRSPIQEKMRLNPIQETTRRLSNRQEIDQNGGGDVMRGDVNGGTYERTFGRTINEQSPNHHSPVEDSRKRLSSDRQENVSNGGGVVRHLRHEDGGHTVTYLDGSEVNVSADGQRTLRLPNGQREVHAPDHMRREYPDGTTKILYPDGVQETRYANGRIRIKDSQGNLLMDSHSSK